MKSPLALAPTPADLAAALADRERLTGRARERYLALLHETLLPVLNRGRHHWRRLALLALLLTPAAALLFQLAHATWPPPWLVFGCTACSLLGLALALGYRRARHHSRNDLELAWATYCTAFRPAVLELFPSLLDRNLPADTRDRVTIRLKRATSLRALWQDRDEEFWSAAYLGLTLGTLLLALGAAFGPPTPAWLLLPLPVAAATLHTWIHWNRRVLAREASGRQRHPASRNE